MGRFIFSVSFFVLHFAFLSHARRTAFNEENNAELSITPIVGRFQHSEGPHWDYCSQTLYFVDIEAQKICRFNPAIDHLSCIYIENGPVGVAIPVKGKPDKLIAGSGTDFVLVTWSGYTNFTKSIPQVLTVVDKNRNGTRWNDGKVDSLGRFWGGTIGPEKNSVVVPNQASFYLIDSTFKAQIKKSPVTNSNGLAWNLQNNILYYIDTPTLHVAAFDFELTKGSITNERIAFDLRKHNISGLPDGMTIDTAGNLWVALYNGGGVIHVDPRTNTLLRFVKLPVVKVTSCTFGGPLLDTLYVTTSSRDLTEEDLKTQPYAGYVFAIRGLGVRGLRANSFVL